MPLYRVWYRDNPEPLEFTTSWRCSEAEILDHVFTHEHIVQPTRQDAPAPTVQELIASHRLAPVRYTEDESEMNVIG